MKNSYQFLKLNLCLIFCWILEMKMPISNVISLEVCTHKGHVSILDVSLDQCWYLSNGAPNPPLMQQQLTNNKLGLILV